MPPPPDAKGLTGLALMKEAFPDIRSRPPYSTLEPSLGSGVTSIYSSSEGFLSEWMTFGEEVRANSQRKPPDDKAALAYRALEKEPGSIEHEHLMCGEEKGVENRFSQSVLHVMTGVARQSKIPIMFGDFRASKSYVPKKKAENLPDYTAMTQGSRNNPANDDGHQVRFIGEAKADFYDTMPGNFTTPLSATGQDRNMAIKRQWVYQPFRYMRDLNLRYSFITTHSNTIFLKLVYDPQGRAYMYYSLPIPATNIHSKTQVSVRECIWFLMCQASTPDGWRLSRPDRDNVLQAASGTAANPQFSQPSTGSSGFETVTGLRRGGRNQGGGGNGRGGSAATQASFRPTNAQYPGYPQQYGAEYHQTRDPTYYSGRYMPDPRGNGTHLSRPYYPGGENGTSIDLSQKFGSMVLHEREVIDRKRHLVAYRNKGKWYWKDGHGTTNKFKLKDKAVSIDSDAQFATLTLGGKVWQLNVVDEDRDAMFG